MSYKFGPERPGGPGGPAIPGGPRLPMGPGKPDGPGLYIHLPIPGSPLRPVGVNWEQTECNFPKYIIPLVYG